MEEDIVDEVAEIKAAHFEESIKYARRYVSDAQFGLNYLAQLKVLALLPYFSNIYIFF